MLAFIRACVLLCGYTAQNTEEPLRSEMEKGGRGGSELQRGAMKHVTSDEKKSSAILTARRLPKLGKTG